MPMHRKNTCKHIGGMAQEQQWFSNNVKRQRMRRDMAKMSRRKNRGKK